MSAKIDELNDLRTLLSGHISPEAEIIKQEITNLTAPGDNYGSVMQDLKATIQEADGTSKVLHLVAKRIPANEKLCEVFNIQFTFKKEIAFYLDIVPALEKFDQEFNDGTFEIGELFAKCYGGRINLKSGSDVVDEDAVILLENIKTIGYEIEDRILGFDEEHTYLLLNDLAKFHGVPLAYKLKKPEEFHEKIVPLLKGVLIDDGLDDFSKGLATDEILDQIKDIDACKPYLETIKAAILKCMVGYGLLDPAIEPFSTIVHSDYWVNNTMILKNNDGKPVKNKFVDLQMPIYNSLTRDVLFFLFSSVQTDILTKNLDNFLKFYHSKLIDILATYNVDTSLFSWDNFCNEIKNNSFQEIGHILIMLKPILTKRGAIDDMANFDIDTYLKRDIVDPSFPIKVQNTVLSFIRNGWI